MKFDAETLYSLLPAIYRIRDVEQGGPLRALVEILAEQIGAVEEDLAQLYDDQFIETCAPWVITYIGDLIGYRTLHDVDTRIGSRRAEVANTIALRRRKGTAAMLEQLARDVTGWGANVVEFFQRLSTSQYMNHIRLDNLATVDLRNWEALAQSATPFDPLAHTADVRWISSRRGRYNIPNVGIFLWRLESYPLMHSPAFRVDAQRYLFNPLGANLALYNKHEPEKTITHLSGPENVPMPLNRQILNRYPDRYYGEGKSLWIEVGGQTITEIEFRDLSDTGPEPETGPWAESSSDMVAIDPELGRIRFPWEENRPVFVNFYYGFSTNLGGGQYERERSFLANLPQVVQVPQGNANLQSALNNFVGSGAVEITNNERVAGAVKIHAAQDTQMELRAANGQRPILDLAEPLLILGGKSAEVTLNGLLIANAPIRVPVLSGGQRNQLQKLCLKHCTLVPGLSLLRSGASRFPHEPSLIVDCPNVEIEIEDSILGGLRIDDSVKKVTLRNCLVDALAETNPAYAGLDGNAPGGMLVIENSTIRGKVHAQSVELASNTIFLARLAPEDTWSAPVWVDQVQHDCIRFSYVPPGSRVPRRFRCQPSDNQDIRLRPQFTSLHYGDAAYGQLSQSSPVEILRGADDEGEMGMLHNLYQPQREINLCIRLKEYLRLGLEAGIFYAS